VVGIAEQPDLAVVGQRNERTIRTILDVVNVGEIERQLPQEKPGANICTGAGLSRVQVASLRRISR